jgi:hypothetical protein
MRQTGVIAALALGVLIALTSGAKAQVCTTICSDYYDGDCVAHETTCTTPEPPKPKFGAIAYDHDTGVFGYSYDWGDRAKAESVALQNCADQNGKACEVMVWFDRKCGAVAAADNADVYWGLGDGEGAARENAQQKCASGGGKNCAVQVAQCSR